MASNKFIFGTPSITRGPVFDPLCLSIASLSTQSFSHINSLQKQPSLASALPLNSSNSVVRSLKFSRTILHLPPSLLFRPYDRRLHCSALRTSSEETAIQQDDGITPPLLQRPAFVPKEEILQGNDNKADNLFDSLEDDDEDSSDEEQSFTKWIDWEDEILHDTRPLVGFVRMVLHSDRYKSGERLSPEDEKVILEKLLPYHPDLERKIGCGVDFISVDNHPEYATTRCLFINRKDGESIDFSFWKCVRGFILKKYPLYAQSFIEKHFRHRRG
eukprot:Gb_04575 [translate_table: standard]